MLHNASLKTTTKSKSSIHRYISVGNKYTYKVARVKKIYGRGEGIQFCIRTQSACERSTASRVTGNSLFGHKLKGREPIRKRRSETEEKDEERRWGNK